MNGGKRVLFWVCFVLFCFVLFCFVLFCFVLFCFVLFCFVLFYVVLCCFVFCTQVRLRIECNIEFSIIPRAGKEKGPKDAICKERRAETGGKQSWREIEKSQHSLCVCCARVRAGGETQAHDVLGICISRGYSFALRSRRSEGRGGVMRVSFRRSSPGIFPDTIPTTPQKRRSIFNYTVFALVYIGREARDEWTIVSHVLC